MLQLSTRRRRNHFCIFISLAVTCENKLLKVYFVPNLQLQKFTLLKFNHQHDPWIVFLHQEKCLHQIVFPKKYKKQFSCYNPVKTSFLAVVVAPVPFPF